MKYLFSYLFLLFGFFSVAQELNPNSDLITYSGKIVDNNSNEFIDFANVSLYNKETNEFIAGLSTENGGHFEIKAKQPNVYLEVSYIGYTSQKIYEYELNASTASFGIITLNEESEMLEEVVVTTDRSTVEFKTDKRVFNVGSDLTSSGASALEVLNNVPSVNVNIEGSVTLRGSSGVQILLNGKPSVLADDESGALGNITAEMIEKVEVITNPSAKYEAEGTSGIINIVLKKNNKKALNGSVSLNVGTPANHSVGVSLNKRTEKFNLFTQFGVGYKEREYDSKNNNTDFTTGISLSSIGREARNENYYNLVLGTDYYLNPTNVITLSGSFTYEIEDQPSNTNFTLIDDTITSLWSRSETTTATNPKLQYELQYKKDFEQFRTKILEPILEKGNIPLTWIILSLSKMAL